MARGKIVVIDDDPLMRDSLVMTLKNAGYTVMPFSSGEDAVARLEKSGADLVITDMKMPGMSGIEVLKKIKSMGPSTENLPVIMVTAFGTIDTAVEAMKIGAYDYLTKPFKAAAIEAVIERSMNHKKILAENKYLRDEIDRAYGLGEIIGKDKVMLDVYNQVERVAQSDVTVMIKGESGTGKELLARAVHMMSPRAKKGFIRVNCAALSAGLLESEMFGHEKGAFTGADHDRTGRFELADGGTILLDEVSEISPNLQAKLLRVLQEKEFEKVGSSETQKVDVRIIATTNRNLEAAVSEGKFREDLYFRLNVVPLVVPPLRERKNDIALLVAHFIKKHATDKGIAIKGVDGKALKLLEQYHWPGNVRELENVMERAIVMNTGDKITAELISPALSVSVESRSGGYRVGMTLDDLEREFIVSTIEHCSGNKTRAAEMLGLAQRTLRDRLQRWREAGLIQE